MCMILLRSKKIEVNAEVNTEVEKIDIPTAYLNAFLHEDKLQVMRMSKYLAAKLILKLKSTCNLVDHYLLRYCEHYTDSAKLWNEHLTTSLINGG